MRADDPTRLTAFLLGTLMLAACGGAREADRGAAAAGTKAHPVEEEAPTTRVESSERPEVSQPAPRVVFLGDSLTAGFGLAEKQAFPAIIGRRLEQRGIDVTVVNAGVSGDTSAGGLSRTDWILRQEPEVLVIGLGANDGLRGLSPEMTESNLRSILTKALEADSRPLLLGMRLPPNLGPDYVQSFESIYPRLAKDFEVPLVPFLLEGVAGISELNLPDGIHPSAEGQLIVADTVMPWIEDALGLADTDSAQDGTEDRTTED